MTEASSENIAHALLDIGAIGFSPDSPVTFKSGILSPVYVDNRILPYYPAVWLLVIQAMQDRIAQASLTFDVIAGIETGGIPHSAALGYAMQRPSVFVRKQAKEHGRQRRVEGGNIAGKRVLLIEDQITTGGSSLSGVEALRDASASVSDCLVITSYGLPEAIANIAAADVRLHVLVSFDTVLKVAAESGKFSPQTIDTVQQWLGDPRDWSTRYTSG
jgi:orotate phosphoribosyltransferase